MPVIAVGLITEFEQAEAVVGTGDADLIALARTILYNPRWPWHAAAHFGGHVKAPDQSEVTAPAISRPFRHRALKSGAVPSAAAWASVGYERATAIAIRENRPQ
jgi:2,4-dienoyl-CoA reductase-like NADH-dependent reductase (Old Yellow Enzyme family)